MEHYERRQQFFKNTVVNTIASMFGIGLNLALGFVLVPVFLRQWGQNGYGLYVLILSINPVLLAIGEMGFQSSMAKYVSHYLASGEERQVERVCGVMNMLFLSIGILLGSVLWLSAETIGGWLQVESALTKTFTSSIRWMAIGCTVCFSAVSLIGFLEGLQRYLILRAGDILVSVGGPVACLVLYMLDSLTIENAIASFVLAICAKYLLLFLVAAHQRDFKLVSLGIGSLKDIFTMTRWLSIGKLSGFLVKRVDPFIVNVIVGVASVGHLNVIRRVAELGMVFRRFSTSALVPFASEVDVKEGREAMGRLLVQGSRLTLLLTCGPVLAIAVFGKAIYKVWLGSEFEGLAFLTSVLLLWVMIEAIISFGSGLLHGTGEVRELVFLSIVGGVLKIVLSVILGFLMGLLGFILGTVFASALYLPGHLKLFKKYFDVGYKTVFLKVILRPVGVGFVLFTCLSVVSKYLPTTLPFVLISVISACFLYWGIGLFSCLSAQERAGLLKYVWAGLIFKSPILQI